MDRNRKLIEKQGNVEAELGLKLQELERVRRELDRVKEEKRKKEELWRRRTFLGSSFQNKSSWWDEEGAPCSEGKEGTTGDIYAKKSTRSSGGQERSGGTAGDHGNSILMFKHKETQTLAEPEKIRFLPIHVGVQTDTIFQCVEREIDTKIASELGPAAMLIHQEERRRAAAAARTTPGRWSGSFLSGREQQQQHSHPGSRGSAGSRGSDASSGASAGSQKSSAPTRKQSAVPSAAIPHIGARIRTQSRLDAVTAASPRPDLRLHGGMLGFANRSPR